MAPRVESHPNASRIASAAVRDKIRKVIGAAPAADRDDVMQATYVRLLMIDPLPPTDAELCALAACIAGGLVVDFHRKRKVKEGRTADGADVDAIALDQETQDLVEREEWRQKLAFVEAEVAAGRVSPDVLRWSKRLAAGDTLAQIAADEGRPIWELKNGLRKARVHLNKHFAKYAAGGAAFAALLVFLLRGREPENSAGGNPFAGTGPAAAAAYRREAADECSRGLYDACDRDLDEARIRDPAGEALPEVKAMRRDIERAKLDAGAPR